MMKSPESSASDSPPTASDGVVYRIEGPKWAGTWKRSWSWAVPVIVLIGLAVTVVMYEIEVGRERRLLEAGFKFDAQIRAGLIEREIRSGMNVIDSLVAFYAGSEKVERDEFSAFAGALLVQKDFVQALEWAPRIPSQLRREHELEASRDQGAYRITEMAEDGRIVPAAEREEYFPVFYFEPRQGNAPAFGFDLASEPTRREALRRAIDTGRMAASGWITPVQEPSGNLSILIFGPIYRDHAVPPTIEERRERSLGIVAGLFRLRDILEIVLGETKFRGIDLQVFDTSDPEHRGGIFREGPDGMNFTPVQLSVSLPRSGVGLWFRSDLDVAGRTLALISTQSEEYLRARFSRLPEAFLVFGLGFTGLLAGYVLVLFRWTTRIQVKVAERTRQLHDSNEALMAQIADREELTRALRASEERLDLAVRGSSDGLWDWNLFTDAVYYSPRFKALLDFEDREFENVLSAWKTRLHPEDVQRTLACLDDHLRRSIPYDVEYRLRTKSGAYRWFRARGTAVRDESGRPVRMAGSITDVTDRKEAEAKLLETNRALETTIRLKDAILDSANYTIISTDLEGTITMFNRAASRFLGYSPEEIVGRTTPVIIHEREEMVSRAEILSKELGRPVDPGFEVFVAKARLGEPDENEWTYVRKDGTKFPVKLSVTSLRDSSGSITGFLGIASDITQAKLAQAELEKLSMVASRTENGVIITDARSRIEWINEGFTRISGYSLEEIRGKVPGHVLQGPLTDRSVVETIRKHLSAGEGFYAEIINYHKSGRPYWIAISARPIRDHEGRIVNFMAIERDITEKKDADRRMAEQAAELARSNSDLEEFAYLASHDLRAPLRAIANLTEWIEEDLSGKLTGEGVRQLDLLRGRVKRMEKLIDDLLLYSRAGRAPEVVETVDIRALLDNIVFLQNPPAGFAIAIGAEMPILVTAKVPLEQVLGNLISNAIKHHGSPRGRVEITAREIGDFYEFAVADDGPGIAPEFHDRIFKMFQTLQARDKIEGSGMGLALVKKLVERLGGSVRIESSPGKGSVFRFTWPKRLSPEFGSGSNGGDLPPRR